MPVATIIKCANCAISFPAGWGGYTYVAADDGRRVPCPHPAEEATIKQVTGLTWTEARKAGRMGYMSYCMCFSCAEQFELDVDLDIKRCPKCHSLEVRTAQGSLASKCPRCRSGIFEEASAGYIS